LKRGDRKRMSDAGGRRWCGVVERERISEHDTASANRVGQLHIAGTVACWLRRGGFESVRFGERGRDDVPISRAVVASSALPGLYPAVEIDGQSYVDGALIRTMNASLALEEGCNLVICINPLVPFDASRPRPGSRTNVTEAGLPTVLSQTFRALIHSRMKVGMASYRSRFPAADLLLLEPDRHDDKFFFSNVFRYADRRRLVNHAYRMTRRDLLRQSDSLGRVLRRHGMRLRMEVLRARTRTFSSASAERMARSRKVTQRLGDALDRLERTLGRRQVPV
jgi:predicted acylesterase/phospholipase RssA